MFFYQSRDHLITCQSVKGLDGWSSFITNLYLSKFSSHSLRGSGNISFFICHMTSCGHVIAGSRNFAGCGPSPSLTSLPSVVVIRLVEADIWYFLIFNVRRRIRIIILLQSVTMQFRRLFWHISYCKVRQSNFIAKCVRLLLQNESGITKCDSNYKVRRNTCSVEKKNEYYLTNSFLYKKHFYIVFCFKINFYDDNVHHELINQRSHVKSNINQNINHIK